MEPIKGFEGLYLIDKTGLVFSEITGKFIYGTKQKECKKIKLVKNGKHYWKLIHRLVAEQFCPNPDNKPHVCFIDGDKNNIHASNLAWSNMEEIH